MEGKEFADYQFETNDILQQINSTLGTNTSETGREHGSSSRSRSQSPKHHHGQYKSNNSSPHRAHSSSSASALRGGAAINRDIVPGKIHGQFIFMEY